MPLSSLVELCPGHGRIGIIWLIPALVHRQSVNIAVDMLSGPAALQVFNWESCLWIFVDDEMKRK